MASKRKSTTPCMVLASEPDPELEGSSELDVGPPLLTPAPTITYDTTSSEEDLSDNTTSDIINKVEDGYDCKYCSFKTTELEKFACHVDSEHPTTVFTSSYTCFDCNFTTEKYESLSEHNVKLHPGGENFKLKMIKRENQFVFEQTVNELIYDGKIVKEESPDQAQVLSEEALGESAVSGISISKTPIMKMMKTKVENKRIAVSHNMGDDIPTEKEAETAIKLDCDDVVVVEQTPPVSESVCMNKAVLANALDGTATMVTAATVFPPGLAQMITTVQAQQNCNLVSKVLIPVNSIPSYNLALDSNSLLLNTYNKFPYPTASEISLLSAQAKCSEEQTKIWFSAQRLKHGVSWTPEEVEDARRKQYNGTVHTIPQTITVFPAHIAAAANGLPSILQTCQIVGQPGLVLAQVAAANTLPVTTPISLTVAGVQNHTQLQKNNVPPSQPRTEPKKMHTVKPPPLTKHENIQLNLDPFGMRSKKSKDQLNALKVSYLKNQFASDAEIERLMQFTGLTKGEIKKWFSDTRYNQRNSKNNHNIQFINDSNSTILIDSSDEMTESPTMITPQRKQSWNPFPDFTLQKFKEKTTEQLQALEDSYLKNPVPADEELNKLRALTKLTRREIDAWFSEKRKAKEIKEEDESEVKENEEGFKEEADEQMTESGSLVKSEGSSAKVAKKSPEQLHMLKAAFVRSQWPTSEEYDKIAQESGIPRSDIVSWFGDARYSWKNGNLKWYYYYQCSGANTQNGQTCARRRGRGRPRGRGRGRPRGRPKGVRRTNWDRASLAIKFKTGKTILKDYYVKHKFLNEQDLDELVAKSHMGYEQVREWFAERMRREESGLDLFEENEDHEEDEDDLIDDIEDEDADTDESDTWEPPRHVRRRLSKTDD